MRSSHNPYKERFAWWVHPWLLALLGFEALVICFGFILGYTAANLISGIVLGGFFCTLPFLTIHYFKNVLIEPNYSVDAKVIEQTRQKLSSDRALAKKEFEQTEVGLLREGKKIPVLETLPHDPKYRILHPYFSCLESTAIDPASSEFLVRLQVGPVDMAGEGGKASRARFLRTLATFLRILARVAQLKPFLPFFGTIVVEVYSLTESAEGREEPFPLLSFSFRKDSLPLLTVSSANLETVGDVRFNDGEVIEPHRGIAAPLGRGGK